MAEPTNQQPVTHSEPDTPVFIAPSLLASNYGRLTQEVRRVNRSGAEWLHLDIMDDHFVPNLSLGPAIVAAIRPHARIPLDVHLMVTRPQDFIEPFADAGADDITVHVESDCDVGEVVDRIRARGCGVGLTLRPETDMDEVLGLVPDLDPSRIRPVV